MVGQVAHQMEQQENGSSGMNSGTNITLEDRLDLSISSVDDILIKNVREVLSPQYDLNFSTPSSLIRDPVNSVSNIYLVDLLSLTVDDYGGVIDRIKRIKAINIESKVVILATERQQGFRGFSLFVDAKNQGLAEILTRPNPSGLDELSYATSVEEMSASLPSSLKELYKTANGRFENVEVVKIGGSIFDLYRQNPEALKGLLTAIVDIHKEHDLVLTVGGGPLQSVPADYRLNLGISELRYEESSRTQITEQARNVVDLLRQISPDTVAYIPPEFTATALRDGWITREFLMNKIPVFSYLPQDSEEEGIPIIPYHASDAHTVVFADLLGSRKIIFAKDTDGIYRRDPNLPRNLFDRLREPFRRGQNEFLDFVYAQNIEEEIERKGLTPQGDVTDEHLIETLALQPFIQARNLYTIQIVNGTKPGELVKAMNGIKAGSYILK